MALQRLKTHTAIFFSTVALLVRGMSPRDVFKRFAERKSHFAKLEKILSSSMIIAVPISGVLVEIQDQIREEEEVKANYMIFCYSPDFPFLLNYLNTFF